ncbi:MAG: hypothetical protein EA402_09300 [Planctomycetota bacterium]|nr:MAG: hypothetical protein EA402_09300 [Planctomycetota bacterium]
MSLHPSLLATLAAAGLLAWSLSQGLSSDRRAKAVMPPGTNERPSGLFFDIDLPPIAPLAHYYGIPREDSWAPYNPFVPLATRLADVERALRPARPPNIGTARIGTRPRQAPPPPPQEPVIAALDLASRQVPVAVGGMLRAGEQVLVIARDQQLELLGTGERIGSWTLVDMGANSAWFLHDDDLIPTRVPIGMTAGDTAMLSSGDHLPAAPSTPNTPTPRQPGTERPTQPQPGDGPRRPRRGGDGDTSRGGGGSSSGIDLNHPLVQQYLENNPHLREFVRNNPEQAQQMLENFLRGQGMAP